MENVNLTIIRSVVSLLAAFLLFGGMNTQGSSLWDPTITSSIDGEEVFLWNTPENWSHRDTGEPGTPSGRANFYKSGVFFNENFISYEWEKNLGTSNWSRLRSIL